jgi:hypothetical protein
MIERDPKLRDRLIDVCRASGASVNVVGQALVEVLMMTVIMGARDADSAEQIIVEICQAIQGGHIREAYHDYHTAEARRATRQ